MSTTANQQERKRKWDEDATEIAATNAGASAAIVAKHSNNSNASVGGETSIFYSLKPDVLELITNFCGQQDCIQLRATCKPMMHAADKTLYNRALANFQKDKPIQVDRYFVRDGSTGFISLAEDDGTFPSKDKFIEMCLEKIDSDSSEMARAQEELATKGISMSYCDGEEICGGCYHCLGKYRRPNGKLVQPHIKMWYRKIDTTTNLEGMITIMVKWMKVYNKFLDWHNSYLNFFSHMPKEKIKTFDEFDKIRDILFGLYVGSGKLSDCAFTTIEFHDYGIWNNVKCTKHFALLSGRKGQKIIFKFGFSTVL